jgi:hypothetical protein
VTDLNKSHYNETETNLIIRAYIAGNDEDRRQAVRYLAKHYGDCLCANIIAEHPGHCIREKKNG